MAVGQHALILQFTGAESAYDFAQTAPQAHELIFFLGNGTSQAPSDGYVCHDSCQQSLQCIGFGHVALVHYHTHHILQELCDSDVHFMISGPFEQDVQTLPGTDGMCMPKFLAITKVDAHVQAHVAIVCFSLSHQALVGHDNHCATMRLTTVTQHCCHDGFTSTSGHFLQALRIFQESVDDFHLIISQQYGLTSCWMFFWPCTISITLLSDLREFKLCGIVA